MRGTTPAVPEPKAILGAWMKFKNLLGVTSIQSKDDYGHVRAIVDALLDEIGDNEDHPLVDVLDYLAEQMKAYEDKQFPVPEAEPRQVLRFLMEQHKLKQEDLSECAPQSHISEILNGKRSISKDTAKKLARRFNVSADLFI
jgi:HTH-type transcriptional regulator/antitoxin HigA